MSIKPNMMSQNFIKKRAKTIIVNALNQNQKRKQSDFPYGLKPVVPVGCHNEYKNDNGLVL